jgi:hypothetical protein
MFQPVSVAGIVDPNGAAMIKQRSIATAIGISTALLINGCSAELKIEGTEKLSESKMIAISKEKLRQTLRVG